MINKIQKRKYFMKTGRIGFSKWNKNDTESAELLWGEPEVTRYICADGIFSKEDISNRLHKEVFNDEESGVQYWPIFELGTNELIGCCGLRPYKENVYEIGFHLRPKFWGQGYATEAANAAIRYAFAKLKAEKLFAGHNPNNTASKKVLSKLGFTYIGDEYYPPTGLYHPSYELKNKIRCSWLNPDNEIYVKYHDEEWGQPLYDDKKLYELLILECFQAGLSWECVLNKRENFREAFDNFDIDKIIKYGDAKKQELMNNPGIIRNRLKINAAVNNSMVFREIQKEYGSFSNYIWSFTDNKVIMEEFTVRTTSPLSDTVSKDLKKRGMTFVGSTIIYSFLQSMGVINAHSKECVCCRKG